MNERADVRMRNGADAERVAVVVDRNGRYALWPEGRSVPSGWCGILSVCERASALAFVERNWTDMRPCGDEPAGHLPVPARLHALAIEDPDRPAILMGDRVVTRAELDRTAAAIAGALLRYGAGPETIVAVALGRTPETIAAFLGVLRAGAAFLPIDPDHPADRIAYQLDDAAAGFVLTDAKRRVRLPISDDRIVIDIGVLDLRDRATDLPDPSCPARRLAYVIYTSGSTGRPKGVCVEHGPLAMHVDSTAAAYRMDAASRELHFLSFAFDGAHERWMVPLAAGGSIVLRGDDLWTAAETLGAIRAHKVTHAGFPTSYMGVLASWAQSLGEAPPVFCYSFGGEAMPRSTLRTIAEHLRPTLLINGYGPTETVISPMVWAVTGAEASIEDPYAPIGAPIGDRRAYILDDDLELVPDGTTGELWLGGSGLARGYLNRPALTAERFLPDPFAPVAGRMYRTGDHVRRRPDGALAYVGRDDGQVKIRGFRVELGEIEARLREAPGVAEAVVVKRDGPAGPRLIGYVTAHAGAVADPARLRMKLAAALPPAAVPSRILVLGHMPLTPNRKIDRAALPEPARDGPPLPLTGATQSRLAALWSDILQIDTAIGADQSFFELGGDSLSALRLLAALHLAYPHRRLGVADLLDNPTVAILAQRIEGGQGDDDTGAARVIVMNAGRPGRSPLVLLPGLLVSLREYEPLVRYLGPDQPVFGFACASLVQEVEPLPKVRDLAQAYAEAIHSRVGPEGCVLLGWSWGGILAFETARYLQNRVPVHVVAMVDVCGLQPPFGPGGPTGIADPAASSLLEPWLAASPMRPHWQALLDRMDGTTRACFHQFLASEPQPLPTDGPLIGSRERILHALVDHALQMRALELAPLRVGVHSFEAALSRANAKPILQWDHLAKLLGVEEIPGADHLDIVLSPHFHEAMALLLSHATR